MKNKILAGLGVSVLAGAVYAEVSNVKTADPVIMTVNGEDVPRSEFEYLYHKNSQQQLEPQSLDEYLEMFKIYKLKVADAKAAGIDTTAAFKKEMDQYKRELMEPYLADSTFLYSLVDVDVKRSGEEVETTHILLAKTRDMSQNFKIKARLDSIRTAILNGADFTEMADKYSQDRSVNTNHGYLGYMGTGRLPFEFESALFETPEGMISEIVESPAGYHIVKPGKHRPSRGKVQASHIMLLVPQGALPSVESSIKADIDSIYDVVKANPERFEELARQYSDDKSSARNGGKLPEFGSGEMVPEFEEVAFSLSEGEISEPVKSFYGWHIIRKDGYRQGKSYEEIKNDVLRKAASPQDSRYKLVRENMVKKLAAKHNGRVNEENLAKLKKDALVNGFDSLYLANWTTMPNSDLQIAKAGNREVKVSDMMDRFTKINESRPDVAGFMVTELANTLFTNILLEEEQDWLMANNEDYRNLMMEYTDGSLLYEISVDKVWDKSSKDTEGLERYFNKNKKKYKWDSPHAKGVLIQAADEGAMERVKEKVANKTDQEVIEIVRNEFPKTATAEEIVVAKGMNPMVDNLVWDGSPIVPKQKNYTVYFMVNERLIDAPEDYTDVKGAVTSDYQAQLEQDWIKEMKKKYPIKEYKNEIKKLKER